MTAESAGAGYVYRAVVRLRESAGVQATIASVDLTFMAGDARLASSRHDHPISDGANVCPASGTIATRELVTEDVDSAHPPATTVRIVVTFSDSSSFTGTASATADVPPAQPPLPPAYRLTGVITDESSHRGIAGARVEILRGSNAGRAALTDGNGTYLLTDLAAGTFRVRASADGHDPGEQNVTVPDIARADFALRPTAAPCAYSIAPSGSLSLPFAGGQFGLTITRTSGGCGWDLASTAAWLTPNATSGTGSATIAVAYGANAAFVGRAATLTLRWTDGSAQLSVAQAAESPAFCRVVTLSVDGRNPVDVGKTGGQFVAALTPESGTPPGVCGAWTATASSGISFVGPGSGLAAPASLTFTVAPNTVASPRTLMITITFTGGGPSVGLTVNQAAGP